MSAKSTIRSAIEAYKLQLLTENDASERQNILRLLAEARAKLDDPSQPAPEHLRENSKGRLTPRR